MKTRTIADRVATTGLLTGAMLAMMGVGCSPDFVTAPYDAELVMPSDTIIGWTDALNSYDLAGFPILFSVGVTDSDGIPLPHVAVEISSGFAGVYILPLEAIEVVGYPQTADGIESVDDVREYCSDENGNYALVEDWCAWYYDINGDQFYAFQGGYADGYTVLDSGLPYYFGPTLVRTQTNRDGLVRMVAMVDTVPVSSTSFESVQILASLGFAADSFNIEFSGEAAETAR